MSRRLSFPLFAAALAGAAATTMATEAGRVELQAPHRPGPGEAVSLQVMTGPLPKGARLEVLSGDGAVLGAVFPFVAPQGSIDTLPIPTEALADGRLRLKLQVVEPGAPPRPPRPGEVERLELLLVPGAE